MQPAFLGDPQRQARPRRHVQGLEGQPLVDGAPRPDLGPYSLLGRPGPHVTGSGHPLGGTQPTATSSEAHVGRGIQTGTHTQPGEGPRPYHPLCPRVSLGPEGPSPARPPAPHGSPCFIFSSCQRTRTCVPDRVVAARNVLWEQERRGPLSDIFRHCRTNLSCLR